MSKDGRNNIKLKLIGKNQEDLRVISAYTQDSIVSVRDIVFLEKNRIFLMMVNRFMWEDVEKGIFRQNKRIRCAIKFEEILKAKSKKINQRSKNKNLECLAIKSNQKLNEVCETRIFFAGEGAITIISEAIEVIMHDLGKPWSVKYFPKHKI